MALNHNPKIVTDGLVFAYDMSNSQKSWRGAPTTNLSTGYGIGTYLNTPADVTSSLTVTDELYLGQPVYKQVLTPVTASGVSYLTNAGNPGIGVVTGGGGGAAARYTGHSIFFKPAAGRSGLNASTPIYTHYSNIGGWQSSGNYDDMGNGWYRAHVIYYNAAGGSDGKYWAINPAGATLGVPLTIYWAAPFKEDRNDSTFVSPYVNDTRASTQAILDLTNNNTITASSLSYNANGTFSFNGSSNFMSLSSDVVFKPTGGHTVENWFKLDSVVSGNLYNFIGASSIDYHSWYWCVFQGRLAIWDRVVGGWYYGSTDIQSNVWYQAVMVTNNAGTGIRFYLNGVAESGTHASNSFNPTGSGLKIGYLGRGDATNGRYMHGLMPVTKVYNRALSAAEIQQNFNAHRGRYGL